MAGRIAVGFIVLIAAARRGIAMYWLQVYAFYEPVAFTPGAEIRLVPIGSDAARADRGRGGRGDRRRHRSPIRFRACFTTPLTPAMLTETYRIYDAPTPLIAPGWFDCFDAAAIGAALERARRWPSCRQPDIHPASTGWSRSFPMAGPLPGTS